MLAAATRCGTIITAAPAGQATEHRPLDGRDDFVAAIKVRPQKTRRRSAWMSAGARGSDVRVPDAHDIGSVNGTEQATAVAWDTRGGVRLAAGHSGGALQVLDALHGGGRIQLVGHTGMVESVAWGASAGEARLASGGADATVRIWDTSRGVEV